VKRIAAIVLCDLACELARRRRTAPGSERPLGVIVDDDVAPESDDRGAVLDAVDDVARRYGARAGQTASEAATWAGRIEVVHVPRAEVMQALAAVAEIVLAFAPTAALTLDSVFGSSPKGSSHEQPEPFLRYPAGAGAGPLDTVWLDVTGCERMSGGEFLFCADVRARLAELGHRARVAVAEGPRLAQALARWGPSAETCVTPERGADALAELPVAALPLDAEVVAWLGKLGVWTAGDLRRLDRARARHRLGARAADVLELVEGRDDVPLRPYQPARRIVERMSFEEPLANREPLAFALRGMVARAAARLGARGEACTKASFTLELDRAGVVLAERAGRTLPAAMHVALALPVPIAREADLLRTVLAKLETLATPAPMRAVELALEDLTPRGEAQLGLASAAQASPDALPVLLAELGATLGPGRAGVLAVVDSHRPEARSELREASGLGPQASARKSSSRGPRPEARGLKEPSRVLPEPIFIGRVGPGALIGADHGMYLIDHLRMCARLDGVEWWRESPVSRDYARVHVHTGLANRGRADHAEAWVFVERTTGRAYLHGWYD
jgi:protein ImuB